MSWGSYYFRTASQLHTILRCLVDVPVLNYPTYDNELHALHQEVKHWRVYLLGKEVVIQPIGHSKYTKGATNDGLMFEEIQLCIPDDGNRLQWVREAHTSKEAGHFGVPSRPWDNISMDRLLKTKSRYDYLFVIVDHFSKMVILIPCKQSITGEGVAKLFFQHKEKNMFEHKNFSNELKRFIPEWKHNCNDLNSDVKISMTSIMCHVTSKKVSYYGYTLREDLLEEDIILEQKVHETRHGKYENFRIGRATS
ncbi:hypothetical protein EV1_019744 [Malus domestica]